MITGNDSKYNLVVKANDLITKSRFSLTTQQQKIVLYLISKINPFDTDFQMVEFSIQDFCRACSIDDRSGKHYEVIKTHIKAIADKSVWVKLENGKETLLRWIEKPYIDERNGTIQIRLDRDMKPFLLQLKKNFTKYELVFTLYFKSKYTIRLYELIKAWHGSKIEPLEITISIDELKQRLDSEKYKESKDFFKRVLNPAVNEINQYSDKRLDFTRIRNGKRYTAIKFQISTKSATEVLELYKEFEEKEYKGQQTFFGILNG